MDGFEDDDAPVSTTTPSKSAPSAQEAQPGEWPPMDPPEEFKPEERANLEAETALLGGLLIDPHRILAIAQVLGPGGRGVFSDRRNDDLFAILVKMASEGEAVDVVTVGHRMHAEGKFISIGGRTRLVHLFGQVTSAAHARYHAKIVRNWAIIRKLRDAGEALAKDSTELVPVDEIIARFQADAIDRIRAEFGKAPGSDGPQETSGVFRALTERGFAGGVKVEGVKTGLADLDALWHSFQPSQFVAIGARTGGGKTSMALEIASNTLALPDRVVLYFSMEMSRDELCQRLIAQKTGISMTAMRRKELADDEWTSLDAEAAILETKNFVVDETAHPTVGQVEAVAERVQGRFGRIDLIVCDGIQLMRAKAENRAQEIGKITRGLKVLAKEKRTVVIGTTQLNRGDGGERNRVPYCRDFKESSSIEQDCDIAVLLWRPDGSKPNENPLTAKANVDKHRNGPTAMVDLAWSPKRMTFIDAPKPLFAKDPV